MRLRIARVGIKPKPWRRVEVFVGMTLLELHAVIQTVMGWEDEHLFCFHLLRRHYDSERRELAEARLADFQLRPGERFTYTYNHSAPWDHELRVEAIGPAAPRRRYPRCIGGRHSCPPEQSFGPAAMRRS